MGNKTDSEQVPVRAPLMRRFGIVFAMAGFFIALLFQNCDGGFHYDPTSGQISAASSGGVGSDQFRLTTFNASGIVVPEGQSFEGGVEYKVVASGTAIQTATLLWQLLMNTGNCVLKAGSGPEVRYVQCDKSGTVAVHASAVWPDGAMTVLESQRTTGELIVDACGPSSTNRPVFRIANGTNANPWNSSASPVIVYVGQVLRICNDDAVVHQMHTDGTPCPHQPSTMAKGKFYDCTISSMNGANATTGVYNLYDHGNGTNAAFYVKPYDGQALYADTSMSTTGLVACANCHGAFAVSARKGRTFAQIKAAIATVPAMAVLQNQALLTDDEIRAIAYALGQ